MKLAEWTPPERLAGWVIDATESLLAPLEDLVDDDPRWMCDYQEVVNPAIWEIAHVAWFAEWFVLRQLHGREPLMADVDARYDSAKVPHITRWHLDYPDPQRTRRYVRDVGEALAEVVLDPKGLDSTSYFALYAIMHHDAHTEALTYTRQTFAWGRHPALAEPNSSADVAAIAGKISEFKTVDAEVAGGRLLLGASRQQPFTMDNERWAHAVTVDPFAMATTPVTVSQFSDFVNDGAYSRESLWSPQGWQWRESTAATAPIYWRSSEQPPNQHRSLDQPGSPDQHRVFDQWRDLTTDANLPMSHVSWWEAEAYCTWAGRRLPSEAEWEMAATTDSTGNKQPWFPWGDRDATASDAALDAVTGGLVPVDAYGGSDGPWGHRQLIGNVWEWTATDFEPYPHFEPDAYRDNSEPWFGSRKVLRGGSWATRSRYVRSTFRNYFTPDRRDVIAGFRTCALRD